MTDPDGLLKFANQIMAAKDAEIERLRRELDWYAKERDRLLYSEAEIERRRMDYSILKSDYDAQRGDIETLQAELRYERTARRALERKP